MEGVLKARRGGGAKKDPAMDGGRRNRRKGDLKRKTIVRGTLGHKLAKNHLKRWRWKLDAAGTRIGPTSGDNRRKN
jgi:hypothetical protein